MCACTAPVGAKRVVGGRKQPQKDIHAHVVSKDLRLCNLLRTWRKEAQERVSLRTTIKHNIAFLNNQADRGQ